MGKRQWRRKIPRLETAAFVALLAVVAGLLVASTRIGDDSDGAPAATTVAAADLMRSGPLTAVVGQTGVLPATSIAGRRRDRVRVSVAVELRSASSKPVSARRALRLEYSGRKIFPDRAAKGAGVLDVRTPIPPNGVRRGELRFELAGRDTRVLRDRGDARLILVAPNGRRAGVTLALDVPS